MNNIIANNINLLDNSQLFNTPAINSKPGQTKPGANAASGSTDSAVRLSLSPEAQKMLRLYQQKDSSSPNAQDSQNTTESNSGTEKTGNPTQAKDTSGKELDQDQLQVIQKLSTRDRHVRNHEAAHMAAAGAYATGGASFDYETGPDGRQYAVGGEVHINMSPVANNPDATIAKAEVIRRGALAPADPSGADLAVAAAATQMEYQARQEVSEEDSQYLSGTDSQSSNANQQGNSISQQDNNQNQQYQSRIKAYQRFLNPNPIGSVINQSA